MMSSRFVILSSDRITRGDKQWVYAFEVHPKGDKKCEVVLSVYNGFDELSPEFKKGMTEEFDTIIASLQKKFK